ncbi:MAG TPA: hypothetical protein IAD08_02160 [Candidatus Scatovivens faecipullorum]|nr:hypothetical protein [Candidatus Scatovivens faecipullorum]
MKKCEICGYENIDNNLMCKQCGNSLENSLFINEIDNVIEKQRYEKEKNNEKKRGKLFGFRSDKLYKKVIATFYYFYMLCITIGFLSVIKINKRDDVLLTIYIILIFHSPWILFSDYKFSKNIRKIPLLRKRNIFYNILFYIVFTMFYMMLLLVLV